MQFDECFDNDNFEKFLSDSLVLNKPHYFVTLCEPKRSRYFDQLRLFGAMPPPSAKGISDPTQWSDVAYLDIYT